MKKTFLYSVLCQEFGGKQKHLVVKSRDEICQDCDIIILHRLLSLVQGELDFNVDLLSVEKISQQVYRESYGD